MNASLDPIRRPVREVLLVVGLAVLVTVLNAAKPPVIDDPTFLDYARQFADHPRQPYAFDYYGKQANDNLVPPILPAWLSCGIGIVGDDPVALKLWLFPILLLFVASLLALLKRFAFGMHTPLLVLTVLSPAFLPSINVMLDIPVLAFGLAATALYLRAADRSSLPLALLAGLLAGVAMETKYTAFVLPALFVLHAWHHGRWQCAIGASLAAVLLFVGCEAWIAFAHGDSHFLLAMKVRDRTGNSFRTPRLAAAAISLSGGLASMLLLIGMTALGASRRLVFGCLGCVVFGFALLILVPERDAVFLRDPGTNRPILTLNHLLFVPPGLAFIGMLIAASRRLRDSSPDFASQRTDRFMVSWLLLEVLGYFAISPFPAVRRILGLLIISTLLVGSLAARTSLGAEQQRRIAILTIAGVVLGFGFYAVELRDALAEREAFRGALRFVRESDPDAVIRYHGMWGFTHHAERERLEWTRNVGEDLRPGDWLIHDPRDATPFHPACAPYLQLIGRFVVEDWLPISTQKTFYESRTPLIHHDGPHAAVDVYQYLPPSANHSEPRP